MFAHLPKMHMVKVDNAFDVGEGNNDGIGIDVHRATQHECSDGAADFCQAQVENIARDTDGDGRINPAHVVEQNKSPANDHGDRRECIRQIVKKQCTDIDAVFLHRIGEQRCQGVHSQSDTTKPDDPPALYLWRIDYPHATFVNQVDPDNDQGSVVDESCNDFNASVAKGHPCVSLAARNFLRRERDDE